MPRVLRARIFSPVPPNAAALGADRALARLAGPRAGAASARRAPARAISRRSGPTSRARAALARARSARPICRPRSRPARWWSRIVAARRFDERALFHLLNLAREEEAYRADHRADARRRPGASTCPILPRGCAPCRWSRCSAPDDALLRAVMVKLFADRQLAVDESLDRLSRDPHRALVCGARAPRWTRSTARRCGCKRPVTRALAAELLGQA